MAGNLVLITDDNYDEEVVKSDIPVVIDFWAPWCGPCRMVTPIIEELSGEYSDRVKFSSFNVDEGRNVPAQFGITSIPTIILINGGREVDRIIGAASKKHYEDMIKKAL